MYHVSQHTNHQAIECRKIVSIRGGFIIFVVFASSSSKKFTSSKKTTLKINRFLIESEDWQKSAKNSQSTKIWSNKFKWFYGITVRILSLNIQISLLDEVAWQYYFVVILSISNWYSCNLLFFFGRTFHFKKEINIFRKYILFW